MKNKFLTFAIAIAALFAVVMAAGCPKTDHVRKAAEASYRLPAATNDLIASIEQARDRGLISVDQARTFGRYLGEMAKSEAAFVQMVKAADELTRRNPAAAAGQVERLQIFFSAQIVNPFLEILELYGVLSGPAAAAIRTALTAVRVMLATIGGGFGAGLVDLLSSAEPFGSGRQGVAIRTEVFA